MDGRPPPAAASSHAARNSHVEKGDATAGTHDATEFLEEAREVDEVPQREATGGAIDAGITDRKVQDVGLATWSTGSIRGEHAETEVHRQRPNSGSGEIGAQVAGSAGEIEHQTSGREAQEANGLAPPPHVQTERHDAVDHVVPRRNGIEHLPNGGDLGLAFG